MANQPIETLRDGSLKATIWKNFGDRGNYYSVQLARSYTDDGGDWKESNSFIGDELLRIARLAGRAYDRATALRASETLAGGEGT